MNDTESVAEENATLDQAEAAVQQLLASVQTNTSRALWSHLEDTATNFDGDYDDEQYSNRENPHHWIAQDDEDDEDGDRFTMMITETTNTSTTGRMILDEDDAPPSPPKRRVLQRADTPVMSNTQKKMRRSVIPQQQSSLRDFGRCHAAIQEWKSNTSRRNKKECDLQLFQALHLIAWNSPSTTLEGNFWLLLHHLRSIGEDSSTWRAIHTKQTDAPTDDFIASLACRTNLSPAALLRTCVETAPSSIRRHHCVLQWLEACFRHVLPPLPPYQASLIGHGKEGNYVTDKDPLIFRTALALFCAGRLEDARRMAREGGVGYLAALWGGSRPDDGKGNGNPNRAMWRRLLWERSDVGFFGHNDEATLVSLLGSNLFQAFGHDTSLDTWEKLVYAAIRCGWDRFEDALLHAHNTHRRQERPPYPGTQWTAAEIEHLEATHQIADMTERTAVDVAEKAPNDRVHAAGDPIRDMTAHVIRGTVPAWVTTHNSASMMDSSAPELLRLGAHWAIVLACCSSDDVVTAAPAEMVEWKDAIVLEYVRFLARQKERGGATMMILYASFLPNEMLIQELPMLLATVEEPQQRQHVLEQMQEHFADTPHLATDLLMHTVDWVINQEESMEEEEDDDNDERKMHVLLWLCQDKSHVGDAMFATNALTRQFILHNKLHAATEVVNSIVPGALVEDVFELLEAQEEEDHVLTSTYSEYTALKSYIHAMQLGHTFQTVQQEISAATQSAAIEGDTMMDTTADATHHNVTEATVARANQHRALLQATRQQMGTLLEAAEQAVEALQEVLEHPGGFLLYTPATTEVDDGRVQELEQLRHLLLPAVVQKVHDTCIRTAETVLALLQTTHRRTTTHAATTLAVTVQQLEETTTDGDATAADAVSPMTPLYWAQRALHLHHTIVNDSCCILSSNDGNDDTATMAELAVQAALLVEEYTDVLALRVLLP